MKLSKTKLCGVDLVATFDCLNKEHLNKGATCETCPAFHGLQVVEDKVLIECSYYPTKEDLEWLGIADKLGKEDKQ